MHWKLDPGSSELALNVGVLSWDRFRGFFFSFVSGGSVSRAPAPVPSGAVSGTTRKSVFSPFPAAYRLPSGERAMKTGNPFVVGRGSEVKPACPGTICAIEFPLNLVAYALPSAPKATSQGLPGTAMVGPKVEVAGSKLATPSPSKKVNQILPSGPSSPKLGPSRAVATSPVITPEVVTRQITPASPPRT